MTPAARLTIESVRRAPRRSRINWPVAAVIAGCASAWAGLAFLIVLIT